MAFDRKYGQISIPGIPDNEPVFILRGKDKFAAYAIDHYLQLCADGGSPLEHLQAIADAACIIGEWPTKKIPD
jgi:hypothetical protein